MEDKLYDVSDAVLKGRPPMVRRYTLAVRINHWIGAVSMTLLAITGLSLYWPPFFFVSSLFGGGQVVRAIHPWLGVIMVVSFAGLFLRMWRLNIWEKSDWGWTKQIGSVLSNHEEKVVEVGKYNFGQKCVFWAMSFVLVALIGTGVMVWQAYFADYFRIELQRYALLIHSLAAIAAIMTWLAHIYAAYWIRGSITAMVKGKVSGGFAWRHHRKWYKALLRVKKPE